ncbi:hypothetical protein D6C95_07465 [Aureobasidium pullulans]|nr:hypothetical protein D6C95_07465 [Aureobasidium pullulans]
MSSPWEMLGFNELLTHVTQDQDDHHDDSSSSSQDDEDVIRPEKSTSQRAPQSETPPSWLHAARSLRLDILPVNMDDGDGNPSPYSKAKRGKRSHENDGSPAKPAWLSQKRSNGRFSK